MTELQQEKIAHLKTRLAMFQAQSQLISVLAQHTQAELKALQEQPEKVRKVKELPQAPTG